MNVSKLSGTFMSHKSWRLADFPLRDPLLILAQGTIARPALLQGTSIWYQEKTSFCLGRRTSNAPLTSAAKYFECGVHGGLNAWKENKHRPSEVP